MKLYGGIEAGGTKFVCVIGADPQNILAEERFPTTTPDETIARSVDFFTRHGHDLAAIGIGSFGPVDLNPPSPTYGYITTTPKPGWAQVDLRGGIQRALRVPVAFDTDVNVAAFGEHYWVPDNRALDPLLYMTVGTGIGVGGMVNGQLLHGLLHPEAGHMLLPRDPQRDPFTGACPYHGDCFEGLACGPAMARRWGQPAETLPPDHPAWQLEAHYVALAVANLALVLSPQRIVIGGGVMQQPGLIDGVRSEVRDLLNGYVQSDRITQHIDQFIVPPALGNQSGMLGAIALAAALMEHEQA
ncbi:MAG: ROK family protein [Chloroflexi bacterium]|nr:ROK family protein [Chloroflexota bacterium]